MWETKLGTRKENLALLGFDKETLVKRALELQEQSGQYKPNGMDQLARRMNNLATTADRKMLDMLWFNVPVCDLTKIRDKLDYGIEECRSIASDTLATQFCMLNVARRNCPKIALNGNPWPFDWPSK